MAVSLKSGVSLSGSIHNMFNIENNTCVGVQNLQFPSLKNEFKGSQVVALDRKASQDWNLKGSGRFFVHAQASLCVSKALRWWDKTLKPNMVEIKSAQELVNALVTAGDNLVVIDFYSPGCGGCKALHPKICQIAEQNPDALFLKVNYEELKPMCYSLNVHVLPFFRFYRGAEGRVCSFSCTNATIHKFRNALAKHGNERCSVGFGPAKGLEESELMKLAASGEIPLDYVPRKTNEAIDLPETIIPGIPLFQPNKVGMVEENAAAVV